jgi:probable rRNA maturation factor
MSEAGKPLGVREEAAEDGPQVSASDEQSAVEVDVAHLEAVATGVLRAEGVRASCELALAFVDEDAIAGLNQRYLDGTGPTDVLAFPLDAVPDRPPGEGTDVPLLLGDVVVCPAVAQRNAAAAAGCTDDELALLVVHGVLHVLGMDHAEPEEARIMQARERDLLARLHRAR